MKLLFTILATTMLIATTLTSAEIIPVWHTGSGAGDIQDIEFLKGHNEFLLLVGVGSEAQLQVRSTETGELINSVPVPTSIESRIAITPDSTRFIHLNGGTALVRSVQKNFELVNFFDVESDSIVYKFTDIAIDPIRPLAYVTIYGWKGIYPNITTKSKVSVYNYETGKFIKDLTELGDDEYSVIEVSEDGKYLATLNDGKAYLKVWNLETMELIINEKLYANNQEFLCESRDIKFSNLNDKHIFISGLFTEKLSEKDLGSGCYIFNIDDKSRQLLLPNEVYSSDNIILLDDETRIFNSERTTLGVLNIFNSKLELYGFPPELIYTNKVIYSFKSNYFIGITSNSISKFLYDSQSKIRDNIKEEIIISPNPTNGFVNINLKCFEPKASYQINDVNGLMIYQTLLQNPAGILRVNFAPYPIGVYFLTINCNNQPKTYKIVKEG